MYYKHTCNFLSMSSTTMNGKEMFQCLEGPLGDLNLENPLLSLLPLASSSSWTGWWRVRGGRQEWKKGAHNKTVGLASSSWKGSLNKSLELFSLKYSCLENPMDGGAWWATVHGVAKSQTRLSDFTHSLTLTRHRAWLLILADGKWIEYVLISLAYGISLLRN